MFFLILPKYVNSTHIQELQYWYSKCNSHLRLKRYCSKCILTSAFICLKFILLFQHGKKGMKTYIILLHMFLLLQETSQ